MQIYKFLAFSHRLHIKQNNHKQMSMINVQSKQNKDWYTCYRHVAKSLYISYADQRNDNATI